MPIRLIPTVLVMQLLQITKQIIQIQTILQINLKIKQIQLISQQIQLALMRLIIQSR